MQDNKLRSFKEIDVKKFQKTVLIATTFLMLTVAASAQISQTRGPTGNLIFQNSTGDTVLNISEKGALPGFFDQDKCGDSEAIKTIYPNGSYACNQLSTTTQAENLSETLSAGNVANRTISMEDETLSFNDYNLYSGEGIRIGDSNTKTTGGDSIAIGSFAEASGTKGVAIGATADGAEKGVGIGNNAGSNAKGAVAIGSFNDANFEDSIALGSSSYAAATGAVAIGDQANAPNNYEATFGNLNGQELDVNVTGNLTIHGRGGLDMTGNNIVSVDEIRSSGGIEIGNSGTSTNLAKDIAIGRGATASGDSFDDAYSTALGYQSSASGDYASAFGTSSSASGRTASVFGHSSSASADFASVFGYGSSASAKYASAFGWESSASAQGGVAIGRGAVADESYTVELGSSGWAYDLNVNGGEINVTDGNVTANNFVSRNADLAEIYSAEKDYESGTVVAVSEGENEVEKTDTRFEDVAGVVSTDPGMVLNEGAEGVEVALEGRVPVKVAEPVEKGQDLAAGPDGKAVACETGQVEELSGDASKSQIVEAVNSLSSNQECLKASFGEALNSSENGKVEVMLD